MRFLYLLILSLFCFHQLTAQEYVRLVEEVSTYLVDDSSVKIKLFKNEVFKLKDGGYLEYGKSRMKINESKYSPFIPNSEALKYLEHQGNYIQSVADDSTRWVFDFTVINRKRRPIFIYKEKGILENNGMKYIFQSDNKMSITKNSLGKSFRIAIRGIPSIVYYTADLEKKFKNEPSEVLQNETELIVLKKRLEKSNKIINNLREESKFYENQLSNKKFSLSDWLRSSYTWIILLLTLLLFTSVLHFLFMRTKRVNSLPSRIGYENHKNMKSQKQNSPPISNKNYVKENQSKNYSNSSKPYKTERIPMNPPKNNDSQKKSETNSTPTTVPLADLGKLIVNSIQKAIDEKFSNVYQEIHKLKNRKQLEGKELVEKSKYLQNQAENTIRRYAKEIELKNKKLEESNTANAKTMDKIMDEVRHLRKIIHIKNDHTEFIRDKFENLERMVQTHQKNIDKINQHIEGLINAELPDDENQEIDELEVLVDDKAPLEMTNIREKPPSNEGFIQSVKPILDLLNQAVSNIRKETKIKRERNRIVNNIIQRFDERDIHLKEEGG